MRERERERERVYREPCTEGEREARIVSVIMENTLRARDAPA